MSAPQHSCWAVSAPGLEPVTVAELRALGVTALAPETGGVAFSATDDLLAAANVQLRTASRIIVRAAEFQAKAFHELERLSRAVRWNQYVAPGRAVKLRVTCKKSRLYHSDAVAERVGAAIMRAVPGSRVVTGATDDDEEAVVEGRAERAPDDGALLIIVRLSHDVCTISVDSSGEPLHKRGYRLATAKAPIRETLAAGMLLALEWDGSTPLLDPMCGAGTIAIEAAMLARRIAPGVNRKFAFETWPSVPPKVGETARRAARAAELPRAAVRILASDRDAGAIVAASANAARAGVAADIEFRECALSAIEVPAAPGLLLTNPPYGDRIGDRTQVRNLYAQLGKVARVQGGGWALAFLSADHAFDMQLRLPLTEVSRFRNGGIPVRLLRAQVPLPKR